MPGRKNPEPTEGENVREYRNWNRREGGTKLQGDEGEWTESEGGAGEVRRERRLHQREEQTGEHT